MKVTMNEDLKELYSNGSRSKYYKDVARNQVLLKGFIQAVNTMKSVQRAEDLKAFSRLHYEKLKYGFSGLSSVRLSNSYVHRLIFKENDDEIEIELIEIDDTHYGTK